MAIARSCVSKVEKPCSSIVKSLESASYCTPKTPARDTLDVWPALPLLVDGNMASTTGTDNIVVALEQSNRVRQVDLWGLVDWQLEKVLS